MKRRFFRSPAAIIDDPKEIVEINEKMANHYIEMHKRNLFQGFIFCLIEGVRGIEQIDLLKGPVC